VHNKDTVVANVPDKGGIQAKERTEVTHRPHEERRCSERLQKNITLSMKETSDGITKKRTVEGNIMENNSFFYS
jgi:hypothetical protein